MRIKKLPWKLGLGIVLVFLAGMVTSVLVIGIVVAGETRRGERNPEVAEERLMRNLTRTLKLDETQQEEVEVVVDDIVEDTRKELGQVIDNHSPRIQEVLDPKQSKRFDFFLTKLEDRLHVRLKSLEKPVESPEG